MDATPFRRGVANRNRYSRHADASIGGTAANAPPPPLRPRIGLRPPDTHVGFPPTCHNGSLTVGLQTWVTPRQLWQPTAGAGTPNAGAPPGIGRTSDDPQNPQWLLKVRRLLRARDMGASDSSHTGRTTDRWSFRHSSMKTLPHDEHRYAGRDSTHGNPPVGLMETTGDDVVSMAAPQVQTGAPSDSFRLSIVHHLLTQFCRLLVPRTPQHRCSGAGA